MMFLYWKANKCSIYLSIYLSIYYIYVILLWWKLFFQRRPNEPSQLITQECHTQISSLGEFPFSLGEFPFSFRQNERLFFIAGVRPDYRPQARAHNCLQHQVRHYKFDSLWKIKLFCMKDQFIYSKDEFASRTDQFAFKKQNLYLWKINFLL